jgi:phosphopantothenate-cysteine ligase
MSLLIPKSRTALDTYGHQIVIGNTLKDRKHEVVFVERSGETWLRIAPEDRGKIGKDGEVQEIEEDIVAKLVEMHTSWIANGSLQA